MNNQTIDNSEKYINAIKYISELYDYVNANIFENALSKPVITISPDESNGKSRILGWFVLKEIWKENEEDKGATEINISAQYLNRTFEEIASTLIHEMCHQFAYVNKIQDCSRSGTYHNKRFRQIAENHGLLVECVKTIGWSRTRLSEDTKQLLNGFKSDYKLIYRLPLLKGQKVKTSSTRKYYCPECGMSVRATRVVNIVCEDCGVKLLEDEQ